MNNSQVAHLWANRSRESARGSHFYFEGDTIYSYGSRFPIARHYKGIVLFTSRNHSVTTHLHKSITRSAASHLTVFTVAHIMEDPSQADVANYAAEIESLLASAKRARDPQWKLERLEREIQEANLFCKTFGLKGAFNMLDELNSLRQKAALAASQKAAKNLERQRKQDLRDAEYLKRWLDGELVNYHFTGTVHLRSRYLAGTGMIMQTTKGASVPLDEAEKAFRFVMLKRVTGWHRNSERFAVGDFQLDAVNEQGVVAGCHHIAWDEIERFAKLQNWM